MKIKVAQPVKRYTFGRRSLKVIDPEIRTLMRKISRRDTVTDDWETLFTKLGVEIEVDPSAEYPKDLED